MSSVTNNTSSSPSPYFFEEQDRFQSWVETNAPSHDWVADFKDMYDSVELKNTFIQAVFKQVGHDFEKLNSDENQKVLLDFVFTETYATLLNKLPPELIREVFSFLDLKDIGRLVLTSKKFKDIVYDPVVSKRSAYNSCFSNVEWARCFGRDILAGEEDRDDLKSLPDNIGEILRSPCPAFPGKRVSQTHVLFRMPRTVGRTADGQEIPLTLKTLGELARKYFPYTRNGTGYREISRNIVDQHGDTPIDESCWMLMTRKLLEESRAKSFADQQAMVADLADELGRRGVYAFPDTLRVTLAILTEFFRTTVLSTPEAPKRIPGTRLLNNDDVYTYTRCEQQTQMVGGRMVRNFSGGFSHGGVSIGVGTDDGMNLVGVVGLRKF